MKVIYTNGLSIKKPINIFRTIYYELTGFLVEPHTAMFKLSSCGVR
jgi:hypothetical protein